MGEILILHFDYMEQLLRRAGSAILSVYNSDFTTQEKADSTPLTEADKRSHLILTAGLRDRFPDIPVLSEEGKEIPFDVRKNWERFWLVDPLDGTKEFIKRNGEFTINVALVEKATPVFGMIYVPVLDLMYCGYVGVGCWEISKEGRRPLRVKHISEGSLLRVICSRSHRSQELEKLLRALPEHKEISRGSALKFCAIAAGEADFYPRMGPTWEWDTGAGQAIVCAAGGVVVEITGKPLTYNKPNLVNSSFLVAPSLSWLEESGILAAAASIRC